MYYIRLIYSEKEQMVQIPKDAYKRLLDDSISLIRCRENIEKLKAVLQRKNEKIKQLSEKKRVSIDLNS